MNTAMWLKFEMADHEHMALLKYMVFFQFKCKLKAMCNYRPSFIDRASELCTSTLKEHAGTDMYCSAMILLKKEWAVNVSDYTLITKVLAETCMDAVTMESLKRKFNVAYMTAKEKWFSQR